MAKSKVKITLDLSELSNELELAIEKANRLIVILKEVKKEADSLLEKRLES